MVMRAESMDLRKLAEGSGGGVAQGKLRKYSSEMASIIRQACVCMCFELRTGQRKEVVRKGDN